jgi:hypothetical protein
MIQQSKRQLALLTMNMFFTHGLPKAQFRLCPLQAAQDHTFGILKARAT